LSGLDIIAFDADDTLWHNLIHFDNAEREFGKMLSEYAPAEDATRQLMEAEKRNIKLYGFGVKSFTL
jgi:putative hydrolase of the HAD superfamily